MLRLHVWICGAVRMRARACDARDSGVPRHKVSWTDTDTGWRARGERVARKTGLLKSARAYALFSQPVVQHGMTAW